MRKISLTSQMISESQLQRYSISIDLRMYDHLPRTANREVINFFTGVLLWSHKAWRKLPVSDWSWRDLPISGLMSPVLVFGSLPFRYNRSLLSLLPPLNRGVWNVGEKSFEWTVIRGDIKRGYREAHTFLVFYRSFTDLPFSRIPIA